MSAMVSVSQQRVNLAREVFTKWKEKMFPIFTNCKTEDGLTVVPNQEAMAIRMNNVDGYKCGRTAVIPCLNGFTAEVREIQPDDCGDSWLCTLALVPKDFPADWDSNGKVEALKNKDDPTKKIFGINPFYAGNAYNVKEVSFSSRPPKDDVIHIRYDKQELSLIHI